MNKHDRYQAEISRLLDKLGSNQAVANHLGVNSGLIHWSRQGNFSETVYQATRLPEMLAKSSSGNRNRVYLDFGVDGAEKKKIFLEAIEKRGFSSASKFALGMAEEYLLLYATEENGK